LEPQKQEVLREVLQGTPRLGFSFENHQENSDVFFAVETLDRMDVSIRLQKLSTTVYDFHLFAGATSKSIFVVSPSAA